MSKIVCEICGTTYDDAAGSCPVCGWNAGKSLDTSADDGDDILNMNLDDVLGTGSKAAAGAAGKAAADSGAAGGRRRPAKAAEPEEDEDDEEEESGSNTFLVIILVLLILALLAVSVYIGWTKLIKPRMGSQDNKPGETISSQVVGNTDPVVELPTEGETEAQTEQPTEEVTEDPGVPCTNLSLVGAMETLTFKGQYWRLMVNTEPQDTTDKVVFTSGDENVVTIDEYGRVTAVGEGETVIIITCGSKRIETPAVVSYPSTATEETQGETGSAEGTATNVATPNAGAVLKLKKTDVTIGKKGVYITLELENGISATDVKWSTSDSGVATVWNGNVTAIGRGLCVITAEYKGQTAECVVRVSY